MVQNMTWFYYPNPTFGPECHHTYSWLETAEHMFSVCVCVLPLAFTYLGDTRKPGYPPHAHASIPWSSHTAPQVTGLFWTRLATIISRPVAARFITPDSEWSREYSVILTRAAICSSAGARAEAVTHITCMLMSENKTIKTCLSETLTCQGCFYFYHILISGRLTFSGLTCTYSMYQFNVFAWE